MRYNASFPSWLYGDLSRLLHVRTRGASCSSAWANGRGFQNCVPNSVHTSSLHYVIDQAFPIFQRATLKNTGRPGYEATIVEAVCKLCEDLNLDIHNRLCGLGSDGASVMLGVRGGVSKLLKDRVPFLVAQRCIAQRLALAWGQSADEISYLKRLKSVLDQLHRFYGNSPVRTAGFRAIQEVLDDPRFKTYTGKGREMVISREGCYSSPTMFHISHSESR